MCPLLNGNAVKDHVKSSYLKGDDVPEAEVFYTIRDVNKESLQGDEEQKLVVYFNERERGMVLNRTNAKRLVKLLGDDGNAWIGKRIKIVTEYVDYPPGQTTRVLRVYPELPPQVPVPPQQAAMNNLPAPEYS